MNNFLKKITVMLLVLTVAVSMYIPVEAAQFDKAYLTVESYEIEGESIVPGEEFELTLVLKNTSTAKNIGSCLITMESSDGMIEPVYGESNQIFIDGVDAGATTNASIKLKAAANIETLTTPLSLHISYADENTLENSNLSTLYLPVSTSGTLKIENLSVPNVATIGTKSRISITYGNSGVDEMNNIVLHIVGSRLTNDLEFPLESLNGGENKYAEAYVDYISVGAQNIQISFTYDDADGLTHETELQSFDVAVSSSSNYKTNSDGTEMANGNVSYYIVQIAIIAIVIVLLLVVVIIYRKKKNE